MSGQKIGLVRLGLAGRRRLGYFGKGLNERHVKTGLLCCVVGRWLG